MNHSPSSYSNIYRGLGMLGVALIVLLGAVRLPDVTADRGYAPAAYGPAADWRRVVLAGQKVTWLAQSPGDAGVVYAAVDDAGVYRSTDGGQNWSLLPIAGLSNLNLQSLAVCPSGTVFVGTWGGGMFRFS